MHQKGFRGSSGTFFRRELDTQYSAIEALYAIQSRAHDDVVTAAEARSTALATIFVIGELVTKTGLEPLAEYGQPVAGLDPN
jgi:hypothetical protein